MKFEKALITGATSGIGEALARFFAQKKIPLILSGRNSEKLEELAAELRKNVDVAALSADLSEKKERDKLLQLLHTHVPDLIINNAGFGLYGEAIHFSTSAQMEILEVNGAALLEITLEGAKILKKAGRKGIILNLSSTAGELPTPGMAVYGASKAFVTSLSRGMDFELKPYGIRVLVACPGQVKTDFANRAAKKKVSHTGPVMNLDYTVKRLWKQIENEKPYLLFDWRNKAMIRLSKLLPGSLVSSLLKKNILKRTKKHL